jgi:hypothetical protein
MIPEAIRIAAIRRQRAVLSKWLGNLICLFPFDHASQSVKALDIVTTDIAFTF